MMDHWINKKGYHAYIAAVRAAQPDMLTLKHFNKKASQFVANGVLLSQLKTRS